MGFHRIVEDPAGITLHDGVRLPPGTHLCLASYAASSEPSVFPNAEEFDGMRYYKQQKNAEEAMKHQHAMTDKNHLHFGHGKYACPGRFFASNELKMMFANILLRYEFKYPEGCVRPANMNIDEFMYVHPETPLLVRSRKGVEFSG